MTVDEKLDALLNELADVKSMVMGIAGMTGVYAADPQVADVVKRHPTMFPSISEHLNSGSVAEKQ